MLFGFQGNAESRFVLNEFSRGEAYLPPPGGLAPASVNFNIINLYVDNIKPDIDKSKML